MLDEPRVFVTMGTLVFFAEMQRNFQPNSRKRQKQDERHPEPRSQWPRDPTLLEMRTLRAFHTDGIYEHTTRICSDEHSLWGSGECFS